MPKISVIIPVYNVAGYLDQCLNSVVNQTFSDIEIILVNDGSTDGSGDECLKWAERDPRIIYVKKLNEGSGPSRNMGINIAKGEYVAFIDADDWYDESFIELIYSEARKTGADIVACGYREVNDGTNAEIRTRYPDFSDKKGAYWTTHSVLWNKLYKRSLFTDNRIEMPKGPGQDTAVMCFICYKANKIAVLALCLYYHRKNREGSMTSNNFSRHIKNAVNILPYLCDLFIRSGDFSKCRERLLNYALYNIRHLKNRINNNNGDYALWFNAVSGFMDSYFPGWSVHYNLRICVLGSYSLKYLLSRYTPFNDDNIDDYCFSGVLSIMSEACSDIMPAHDNPFRNKALYNDFNKTLVKNIRSDDITYDYMIIDFLDERFDIFRYSGSDFTLSDALREAKNVPESVRLKRWDDSSVELWKKRCLDFISVLKLKFSARNVILVKQYLTEYYGVCEKEQRYENWEEIRFINSKLSECYSFFADNYQGIAVIEADNGFHYSFKHFRHGIYPWHYNEEYYFNAADAVMSHIKRRLIINSVK